LLCHLLLLKLLLPERVLQVTLGFLMLLQLLDEKPTTEAARTAILTSTVLEQETSEKVVLTLRSLTEVRFLETYNMEGRLTLEVQGIDVGIIF
jgi:hypothetical protein